MATNIKELDAFSVGDFGFYRDPSMTMRLTDDNLYDQIGPNGWVDVWFGGNDLWLPDFGTYSVNITTDTTFFWDIVDEDGKRTKTGFQAMHIPYNPLMKPFTGDLIPQNDSEVFPWTKFNPATEDEQLICSNLWFYTNYFDDNYYRYNLLVLNRYDPPWPNEIDVDVRPMNDNLFIHKDEYIAGYRPKIEYMNQLAIVDRIVSGSENKIWFRFKVDLDFLANNPNSKRYIRIFSTSSEKNEVLFFPRSSTDIIWHRTYRMFKSEYQRYILENGIMQYMPTEKMFENADIIYNEYMKSSNYILKLDSSNMMAVANDIDRILSGDNGIHLVGYSALIIPHYISWMNENLSMDIPYDQEKILFRVVLTKTYYKGFDIMDEFLGDRVGNINPSTGIQAVWDGDVDIIDGNYVIANGGTSEISPWTVEKEVWIVEIDGVKQFEDGYTPRSAKEYFSNDNELYVYKGDIGDGVYKILIGGYETEIFCSFVNDECRMYLITGGETDTDYIKQFGDTFYIDDTVYFDEYFGVGWGKNDGENKVFQSFNIPFSGIGISFSGEYDNPAEGTGHLEIVTNSSGTILKFDDDSSDGEDGQTLIVNGVEIFRNEKTNIEKREDDIILDTYGDENNISVKMRGDKDIPYTRRYIDKLYIY